MRNFSTRFTLFILIRHFLTDLAANLRLIPAKIDILILWRTQGSNRSSETQGKPSRVDENESIWLTFQYILVPYGRV
jgi:hypothetical protein